MYFVVILALGWTFIIAIQDKSFFCHGYLNHTNTDPTYLSSEDSKMLLIYLLILAIACGIVLIVYPICRKKTRKCCRSQYQESSRVEQELDLKRVAGREEDDDRVQDSTANFDDIALSIPLT